MTTYAKYYKQRYPVGNQYNTKEQKMIESAQCGIGDEATLRTAVANADANDLLVLAPCTITLTQQLVIDKPLRIKGSSAQGAAGTKLTGTLSGELVSIELDAFSSAAEVVFENILFYHGTDDVDVIAVNNTNASAALTVKFHNCSVQVYDASAAAFAVDVGHATAGQAVKLIMTGRGDQTCDAIGFAVKNAGDLCELHNMKMQAQGKAACVVASADAVAGSIQLYSCEMTHEKGVSGGNAAQLLLSMHSWSRTGTTYAAADTNDLIGSQTETIV